MCRSLKKNTFVDDGNIQIATNRFDSNTYFTVSGGNFALSLVF